MNEPRPLRPRPGPRSGPRPVHRPAPHAPAPKRAPPGKGMWIAIGAGAIVVILLAVVMMSGKKPVETEPVAEKTAPEKTPPKTPPPPPPPPPKAPPPPVVDPPPPPPKKAPQDPVEARKEQLAEKAKQDREAGAARLAEARAGVDKDLEREKAEAEAFQKRFADLRLDIKLTSNQEYKQALITGFNEDELRIKPADRDAVVLPWLMIAPETVSVVAHKVYRSDSADDLLALARFCVERRLWKEAQAALQKLKKVDEDQERLVDRFEEVAAPLITGKGLFQGALKTTGPTGIRLAYDFSDPAQADDFKSNSEHASVEGGKLTLESVEPHGWVIADSDLEFWEELDIEGAANIQGAFLVIYNQRPGQDYYILELGPDGIVLKKGKTPKTAKELSKNAKAIVKGEQKFKVTIRRRKVSVTLAGKPAFSFEDPDGDGDTRGRLQLGVSGGRTVFSSLVIDGQANPDYLKKKIGTIEMEARRSISKDLGDVKELNAQQLANQILGGSSEGISADELVLEFLNPQELPDYNNVKLALSFRLNDGEKYQAAIKNLDLWLEKRAGFPSLWYLAGIRHFNHSELGEARDKFAKAVALFPNFYEAHYQMARTWWYAREFAKALEETKKALAIRPDYAAAHVLMGQMLFAVDKKASREADLNFRIAEKLDADAAEMLHERRRVRMVTRGPRDLGCVFEQESANYLIVTDISAERAKWYASQLEVVRSSYLDAFKRWYGGDPRPKPRIAIFNTREAFYTYTELSSTDRRENLLGFFDPANNELVLFEDLDLEDTLQVLYHEAFHHFASAMLKFPPYWWNEGIAEYMSAVKLDPQGREIKERARMLAGRLSGMKMWLMNDFYVPFEQIINYSPGQFYSGMIGLHYAQAWTMVHFLYEFEKGKYRPLIEQYFDELVRGRTQRQAFEAVFEGKTEQLEKEWLAFTKALKVPKR
jgi:hypothetical protein